MAWIKGLFTPLCTGNREDGKGERDSERETFVLEEKMKSEKRVPMEEVKALMHTAAGTRDPRDTSMKERRELGFYRRSDPRSPGWSCRDM